MNDYALHTKTLRLLGLVDNTTNRAANEDVFNMAYNEAYKIICRKRIKPVTWEQVTLTDRSFSLSDLAYIPVRLLKVTRNYVDYSDSGEYIAQQGYQFEIINGQTVIVPGLDNLTAYVFYEFIPNELDTGSTPMLILMDSIPTLIPGEDNQSILCYYACFLYYQTKNQFQKANQWLAQFNQAIENIPTSPGPSRTRSFTNLF